MEVKKKVKKKIILYKYLILFIYLYTERKIKRCKRFRKSEISVNKCKLYVNKCKLYVNKCKSDVNCSNLHFFKKYGTV